MPVGACHESVAGASLTLAGPASPTDDPNIIASGQRAHDPLLQSADLGPHLRPGRMSLRLSSQLTAQLERILEERNYAIELSNAQVLPEANRGWGERDYVAWSGAMNHGKFPR